MNHANSANFVNSVDIVNPTNSAHRYAALIVAAGFSSRMQCGFKPLLPIPFQEGTCTALEYVINLYRGLGIERIVVVSGHRREELEPQVLRLGATHIHNPQTERGMFSSVCAGLETLLASGLSCFVHPVDIPLVRPCTVQALLQKAEAHPKQICLPTFNGEPGHPPLLHTKHIRAVLEWTGENGLHGILQRLPQCLVPVADSHILQDMDTNEDYANVCARAPRRHILEPEEAQALLRCCAVSEQGMAHAHAVARIAKEFTNTLNQAERGRRLDPLLAEAGALLHDICKGERQHEHAAGVMLRAMGLPTMALLVEEHRDCTLPPQAPLTEKELVYLADKYVHGWRLISVETRFGQKLELYAKNEEACRAIRTRLSHAQAMEERLFQETGVRPFTMAKSSLEPAP